MTLPIVPFEAERHLDWIAFTDFLARAHDAPRAEVSDSFLYRGNDTLLNRAAWIDGMGSLVKTATIFPGNTQQGLASVNGGVSLFSDTTGQLEALLDFHLVTKWKTVGDSLLAARRLARPDSRTILVVGAGTVATSLIEAYGVAFPNASFQVWNRNRARGRALCDQTGATLADDLEAAVRSADIVTSATMTTEPLIRGDWLKPGQHIDLIGAFRPDMREADDTAIMRARVFMDSIDTTVEHIGELIAPIASGAISRGDIVADFYNLSAFSREPEDITLFKNGGGAHLDLMTSRYILEAWLAAE